VRKRIVIAVAAVLLVALATGGVLGALWYRDQTETKIVRGSSTIEFVTTEPEPSRPVHEGEQLPWPMYGHDEARTKYAPEFKHRPPYREIWNVQTGHFIEFPPAVADGLVFVANQNGDFMALRGTDGRVVWRKELGSRVASGPAVIGGIVYLGVMNPRPTPPGSRFSMPGYVLAVDAKTGRQRWRFDTAAVESSPLVVDDLVYVGAWNHRIYALNRLTGKVRWSYDAGAEVNSSGAFGGGTVFFGTDAGHLFALDARTGAFKWRGSSFSRFGRREYFYSTPVVAYGRVFIGNTDGTLYAFGATSGNLLWAQPAGTYLYASPAVWKKRILTGTYDGRFSAFDAATGDRIWSWEAPSAIHGAPTVIDGLVYFSTAHASAPRAQRYVKRGKRGTYALDARTGKPVWAWPGMGTYSPVVADEERVYLVGSTRVVGLLPVEPGSGPTAGKMVTRTPTP
jgi:outer membrane protein assembly factor BamB